jgi:hypothetical protein
MVAPGITVIRWSLVSGCGRPLIGCAALAWTPGVAVATPLAFTDSAGFPSCCGAGAGAPPTAADEGEADEADARGTADVADPTDPDGRGSDAAACDPGAILEAPAELAVAGGRLPVALSLDVAGTEAAFAFGLAAGATPWR